MITIREIADDKSSISSTRWAFATVIRFDLVVILGSITAGIVAHFMGKPLDNGFYGSVAMLLGLLTTLATGAKALQGFEPNKDKPSGAHPEAPVESTDTDVEPEITEGK